MNNAPPTVLDRLAQHAQETPDRLAYTFLKTSGSSDSLTYRELAQRVRTLAAHYAEQADPGDRALLLYPPGLEFIEAFLGCLAAGIVAVPAYPPRKNRSADRLLSIIDDCTPRLVLTTKQAVPSLGAQLTDCQWSLRCIATDAIETSTSSWQAPEPDPQSIAFLQYTSGSTGNPRGVVVSHENIVSNEEMIRESFRHTRQSVMVSWLPMFHDMGLIGGVLQPLYVGFPSILLSPVMFLQEPIRWLQAVRDYRGTTTGAPNFAWDHCVKYVSEEQKAGLDLSSLQVAYNGAEPIRAETLDRFAAAFSGCGFNLRTVFPCYGLAESTLFVSGGPPQRAPVRRRVSSAKLEAHVWAPTSGAATDESQWLVSSGRVAAGTRLEIVNPETHERCAPGEVGEIWIGSDSVARGYWNNPEETRKQLQARLAESDEGPFLRTGDLGYLEVGELFITGRLKDLIIIRGRNLYPQDLEGRIERCFDLESNGCAAFAIDSGSGEKVALVIEASRDLVHTARAAEKEKLQWPAENANASHPPATSQLEATVGVMKQVICEFFEVNVHAVTFVRPGSFPRTSSGKVQRRACREGMLAGTLDLVHAWQAVGAAEAVADLTEPVGNGQATEDEQQAPEPEAVSASSSADPARQHGPLPYSVAIEHLTRSQQRHALLIALAPLVGMAVLAAVLGASLVTPLGIALLVAMYSFTMLGITVGFHRLFTHNAFKTTAPIRMALAVGGSMAGEAPLIYWVATHRRHHQYSDEQGDPHSPHLNGEGFWGRLKGLWYAHAGWMYHHETTNTTTYAKDLLRDPAMQRVNGLYFWIIVLGLAVPAAIGGLVTRSWLGAAQGLFWGGFCRLFLTHHFTWSINSICHVFGRRDFCTSDHSANNVWLALPTMGESWHNNHHAAPSTASFSRKWWQVDLGGALVRGLEMVSLAWDVKRVAQETPSAAQPAINEKPPAAQKPRGDGAHEQQAASVPVSRDLRPAIHEAVLNWVRSEVDQSVKTIPYDAPFASLGVDSVGAASIALVVERSTLKPVAPEVVYEHPTIDQLARYLEEPDQAANLRKELEMRDSAPR